MGNISSNAFSDERVLFATRSAAENWRASLNTNDATTSVSGAVKKATLPANVSNSNSAEYIIVQVLQPDGSYTEAEVPSRAAYDAMKTLTDELKTKLNSLIAAMVSANQGEQ